MACSRRIFNIRQTPDSIDVYIYPDSDVCTDFDRFGDTPNFACVDEPKDNPDDDITYVYTNSTDILTDLYGLPNQSLTGTINYIQVYARAKSHITSQEQDGIFKILLNPDGQCTDGGIYKSADIDLVTSYTTYVNTWTTNPQTAIPFVWDDIDNMAIGVECNSPLIEDAPSILAIRPNLDGDVTQLTTECNQHYQCVDEAPHDGYGTINYNAMSGTQYDLYELDDHTTEAGTITKVVVHAVVRSIFACPNCTDRTMIKTHGVEYEGVNESVSNLSWDDITTTYLVNPNTTNAWTWAEIDDLQAGIKIYTDGVISMVTQVYVLVYYDALISPQIRTTQCYAKVNYAPGEITCTLNRPEKISTNHSRNIQMLNFWSGNRAVYDLNRSGKSMVLTGTEWEDETVTDACARVECIRQLAENGADVTINDLGSALWNGVYKIRSFGWKHVSECPNVYDWILEVEDIRYCSECGDDTYD